MRAIAIATRSSTPFSQASKICMSASKDKQKARSAAVQVRPGATSDKQMDQTVPKRSHSILQENLSSARTLEPTNQVTTVVVQTNDIMKSGKYKIIKTGRTSKIYFTFLSNMLLQYLGAASAAAIATAINSKRLFSERSFGTLKQFKVKRLRIH